MNLTAIISRGNEYFIGQIKELPGVLTQGTTIEETKRNLIDALDLWLEDAKDQVKDELVNVVHTEKFTINVH